MTLQSVDDFTPDFLTDLLRRSGLLPRGQVASIQCEPILGTYGKPHQIFTLHVKYTGAGLHPAAGRFFLKFGRSAKEVFFYTTIAREMAAPPLPLPVCYIASYASDADQACLLLEDLSETHFQTEWPLPPTDSLCFRVVADLARIHALWWENARLENEFRATIPAGRSWPERRRLALENLPAFIDFLGDRLSPPRRAVYERMLAAASPPWEPARHAPHQTLLHGDMNMWNVFFPRDPAGACRFFDWNMWDIGSPSDDLAYLIAMHWYPERRARLEQALLLAYYDALTRCGVQGYSVEAFQQDYRRSVLRSLLIPAWQWVRGILPGIWWPHLERTFLAFEDLGCAEFLL